MKWIGQHIYDLVSRFRDDVYLESVSESAQDHVVGIDANGKLYKQDVSTGDITGVRLTTDDTNTASDSSGSVDFTIAGGLGIDTSTSGTTITIAGEEASASNAGVVELATTAETTTGTDTGRAVTPDGLKDGYQGSTNVTTLGTIATGTWQGTAIAHAYIGNDAIDGDNIADDAVDSEHYTDGSIDTAHIGDDQVTYAKIQDVSATDRILGRDSAGAGVIEEITPANLRTMINVEDGATADQSKSDIDGLAITTVGTIDTGTWEGTAIASDQQKHVMHYQTTGYATGDGTNYEISKQVSANTAPFQHDVGIGADGLTAQTPQTWMRTQGHVMPRACTLKRWTGWAASAGSGTTYIGLFKVTMTRNSSTTVSAVLLEEFSYTALGNNKNEDFDETSFTATAIAAGDIVFTAMKGVSSKAMYFNGTFEVEF